MSGSFKRALTKRNAEVPQQGDDHDIAERADQHNAQNRHPAVKNIDFTFEPSGDDVLLSLNRRTRAHFAAALLFPRSLAPSSCFCSTVGACWA